MIKYNKQKILDECSSAINDINTFYRKDFLKNTGKTSDTNEYYTEIIAEFVIANIKKFEGIKHITRKGSYKAGTHDGVISSSAEDSEENTAKRMYNQCNQDKEEWLAFIGKIIDYQTPLDSESGDNAGAIDLLSDDGKQLIILELKRPDNTETMLRCVLEGYTYLKTVDKAKLLKDFGKPADYGLSTSPFVLKGGEQWKEMQEDRPKLNQLMKLLNIKPYYYSEKDGKFIVEDK